MATSAVCFSEIVTVDFSSANASARKCRKSSPMSFAVVYRSEARFDRALRQMRSSSFGIVSSHCRGGRTSMFVVCSSSSSRESA